MQVRFFVAYDRHSQHQYAMGIRTFNFGDRDAVDVLHASDDGLTDGALVLQGLRVVKMQRQFTVSTHTILSSRFQYSTAILAFLWYTDGSKEGGKLFHRRKVSLKKIDVALIITVLLLCIYGMLVLYSATHSFNTPRFVLTQMAANVMGIIAILALLLFDQSLLKQLYIPIYVVINVLLVLVLIFGTGEESWGARSWLHFGPINFQPSEIAKIGLLICLSVFIEKHQRTLSQPRTVLKLVLFISLPLGLIFLQPDYGTLMVFVFFIAVMLFTAGLSMRYFIGVAAAGIAMMPIAYSSLDEFQKNRILNFLDPMRDIGDTGYQANQGRIAIGSGQLSGRGYLQGVQTQYNFIPTKETDYIFAVLVEELGLLGGLALLLLYFMLLFRLVRISMQSKDLFGRVLCMGIAAMFLFHIFENIGMTIGVMPITGIPLPFFSYGGTFQMVNLFCIGLALSCSIQKQPLDFSS